MRWGLLWLTVSACQCGTDAGLVRLAPKIEVAPNLDFGPVPIGATKRIALLIENPGNAPLVLQSADTMAPFGATLFEAEVPPGGRGQVEVWFRPVSDAPAVGTLLLATNAEDAPMVQVALTGQAVEGVVSLRPAQVDFGALPLGVVERVELVVDNLGLVPVEGRLATESVTRPEHFRLTGLTEFASPGRLSLEARGNLTLDLEYRPLAVGTDAARIVFEICGERCGLEVEVVAACTEAAILLEPQVLDFGRVGLGEERTLQLAVHNRGTEPVDILELLVQGSPALSLVVGQDLPLTLAPSATHQVLVEFHPQVAGRITGQVVVRTADPVLPTVLAAVVGEGEGPSLVLQPSRINFGVVRLGQHRRAGLVLNAGSAEARITAVSIQGAPELTLETLPSLPSPLGPGESEVYYVAFDASNFGSFTATVSIATDAGNFQVPVVAGAADRTCVLQASPERINFGQLPPGFVRRASVTVTNAGDDPCRFLSQGFRPPLDASISVVTASVSTELLPGQSWALEFEFAPTERRPAKAIYGFTTDDPVFPERSFSLVGTAEGYVQLFAQPGQIDFGSTRPQCTVRERRLALVNAGTVDVLLESAQLLSSAPELGLRGPTLPQTLRSGTTTDFIVSYQPPDIGPDQGFVEFQVRDLPFPILVPVSGDAQPNATTTDIFTQQVASRADVLFVIDDSCSMGDDQRALATNLSAFIQQAGLRQIDFQMGITTTSILQSGGVLVGPVMATNDSNLVAEFSRQAMVGTRGSGFEQGLEAALLAFKAAERGQRPNANLFRAGASKAVIIVSDEDDQSPAQVAYYFGELRARAPAGLGIAVVGGGLSGCSSSTGHAAPSPRYSNFVQLGGGIFEPICGSWANSLSNIGALAFGLRRNFPLSQIPEPGATITVTIDGQVDTSGIYDPATNSVTLPVAPNDGAEIRIEYVPRC